MHHRVDHPNAIECLDLNLCAAFKMEHEPPGDGAVIGDGDNPIAEHRRLQEVRDVVRLAAIYVHQRPFAPGGRRNPNHGLKIGQ